MPKLVDIGKMAVGALTGGWSGVAILILLGIGGLGVFFGGKKWWKVQTQKKTVDHRIKEQAKNPIENRLAEDSHRKAENAIEDLIKGNQDA